MPVHVLTGRSGIGKSAFLIRPLRWLVFNKPLGTSYRKWGSIETRVDVWFDDITSWVSKIHVQNFQCHGDSTAQLLPDPASCTRVSRVRTNKDNYYEMQHDQDAVQVFKIAGNKQVPEPISSYLNMTDINFQFQHDPIYLLGLNSTPLELARVMNRLAGMGEIDAAYSRANSMVRDASTTVNVHAAAVEKHQAEVDRYAGLDELEMQVGVSCAYESEMVRLQELACNIGNAALELDTAEGMCKQYAALPKLDYEVERSVNNMLCMQLMLEDAHTIGQLAPAVSEYDKYFGTETLQQLMDEYSAELTKCKQRYATAQRLHELVEHAKIVNNQLNQLLPLTSLTTGMFILSDGVTRHSKTINSNVENASAIGSLVLQYTYQESVLGSLSDLDNAKQRTLSLENGIERSQEICSKFVDVYNLVSDFKMQDSICGELDDELWKATEQFDFLMPAMCPLCGKPTTTITQEDIPCRN